MKTLKIDESTHKILKWIQSQEYLNGEKDTAIDTVIFKSLVHYAKIKNYNLEALKELIPNDK